MSLFLSDKLKTIAAFLLENTVDTSRSVLTHRTSKRIKRRLSRLVSLKGKQPMIPKSRSTHSRQYFLFDFISIRVKAQFGYEKLASAIETKRNYRYLKMK